MTSSLKNFHYVVHGYLSILTCVSISSMYGYMNWNMSRHIHVCVSFMYAWYFCRFTYYAFSCMSVDSNIEVKTDSPHVSTQRFYMLFKQTTFTFSIYSSYNLLSHNHIFHVLFAIVCIQITVKGPRCPTDIKREQIWNTTQNLIFDKF